MPDPISVVFVFCLWVVFVVEITLDRKIDDQHLRF